MPANYKLPARLQMARTKIYPASRYYTGPRVPGEIYGSMGRPLKRLRKSGVPTASLTEEQGSSAIQAARPVSTGQQSVDIGTIDCASPSSEEPAQSTSREPEAPEEPEARATSVAPSSVQRVAFQYVLPLFTACNGRHDDGSAPQESLAVASRCSTDHETWLAGGSILYPARLQATLDTEPAGDPQLTESECGCRVPALTALGGSLVALSVCLSTCTKDLASHVILPSGATAV